MKLTNLTFQLNLADWKFACFSLGLCVQVKKISIWLKKSTIIKFMKSQIMEFQFAAILKLIKKRCRLQTEWNDIDFRIPHRQWFGLVRFRVNQGFFPITISDDVIHGKGFRLERFWVNQFFLFSVMKRYIVCKGIRVREVSG